MRPSTTGLTGWWAAMYVADHVEQELARELHVRALGEDGVAVTTGVHEVVGDEPDGVASTDRGSGPAIPFGAFQIVSTTGVVPLQWNWTLRPEICGNRPVPPAKLRIADRGEPVEEGRPHLRPGEGLDDRGVAERQDGEQLAWVIWQVCSVPDGGVHSRSWRRPPELV